MKKSRLTVALSTSLCALAFHISPASAALLLTGNAEADFTGPGVMTFADDTVGQDVTLPSTAPPGTVSGWDMNDVRFFYDAATDTMQVGFNTYVIAGDADGDGNPSGTSAWLAANAGVDMPDMGSTESFALMLDIDEDNIMDVIAGVSAIGDTASFQVAAFSGSVFTPAFAFGSELAANTGALFASPSAAAPDIEFSITNFTSLPFSSSFDSELTFGFSAFMGSLSDDGIGDDFLPGVGTTYQASITPAVPIPAAAWLFGSGFLGLVGVARRKKA